MRRYFNTEGWCRPDRHYMVRLEERLDKVFYALSEICDTAKRPVVLMIDGVDNASNNQVFVDFLA